MFAGLSGANVKNYGLSGTRIARQTAKSKCEQDDRDFLERADEMDINADVIVVFGGTNDFGTGDAPIGDFDSKSEYTFFGAMHCLCKKLLNKYPNAEIVFLTPLHRKDEKFTVDGNGISHEIPLSEYVSVIKEVAGYYGLPVLDLFIKII